MDGQELGTKFVREHMIKDEGCRTKLLILRLDQISILG